MFSRKFYNIKSALNTLQKTFAGEVHGVIEVDPELIAPFTKLTVPE